MARAEPTPKAEPAERGEQRKAPRMMRKGEEEVAAAVTVCYG